MIERFTNNAAGTLSAGIGAEEVEIVLNDDAGAARFAVLNDGEFQRATLYAPDDPGAFEVVHITQKSGTTLTVLRGQEATVAQSWDAGAKIGARVTASMLRSFLAIDQNNTVKTQFSRLAVNGRTTVEGSVVQIAGFPVLTHIPAQPTASAGASMPQDRNLSHESVGGTLIVDLGDSVPTWVSEASYPDRSIVAPTTPTGFNYVFEAADGRQSAQTITEPLFDDSGYSAEAFDSSDNPVGLWVPVPDPLVFVVYFGGFMNLCVTEVGFICLATDATTDPSVSIGTSAENTRFANDVALTQISGNDHIHRIPITAGGAMVNNLRFAVTTEATGRFIGRFYWRGFFVQSSS